MTRFDSDIGDAEKIIRQFIRDGVDGNRARKALDKLVNAASHGVVRCTCGGGIDQPASEHDISCPAAIGGFAQQPLEPEEPQCEIINASSMSAATSSDQATAIRSSSSSNVPATELPESVRIPLHSLQADLGYLIGRVIADGLCGPMVIKSMQERLDQIEAGTHGIAQQPGIMEATAAQHVGLLKGEPAKFVRNGKLETCQCRDCRDLAQGSPDSKLADAIYNAPGLYLSPADSKKAAQAAIAAQAQSDTVAETGALYTSPLPSTDRASE